MIRITYDERNLTIRAEGYAGFAEPGQDIVCAAVSILLHTLAINLQHFEGYGWYELEGEAEKPGDFYIRVIPRGYYSMVTEMMRFTMRGLKKIAEQYGDYIRIKEDGTDGGI
jgi:uncharacterized protein YsxB (DUF464 family)